MKKKICWLLGAFFVFFIAVAFASDVADVAKKEKERREKTKEPVKTITNKDVEDFKTKNKIPDDADTDDDTETQEGTDDTSAASAAQDSSSEDFWAQKLAAAEKKIDDAQAKLDKIQATLDQMQLVTGTAGQGQLQGSGQTTDGKDPVTQQFDDRAKAQQELDDAKAALEALQEEARQGGIPPGWVTPKEE